MSSLRTERDWACRLLLLSVLCNAPSTAQVSLTGSLGGQVLDPSGRGVPLAKITLTRESVQVRLSTATDAEGTFQIAALSPGRYSVVAERPGFQRLVRDGVTIEVNQHARITLTLSIGDVATTVSVREDVPAVQSQTSEISLVVDQRSIRDLPLNGKDFQKLVSLAPGNGNFRSNNTNSNAATSGSRESSNNYVIDGITANDERETAGLALGASFRQLPNVISTEALAEFRVITSNADATFGRGSGAQINVVTKSGSNEFHGSAYEYLRNSALDARDFFNRGPFFDEGGKARTPPFRQNLFGGTFGGAIHRYRDFVFASYEGFRQRLEQTSAPVLPSADLVNLMPGQLGRLARAFFFDQSIIPRSGYAAGEVRPFSAADRTAAIAVGFPAGLFDGSPDNGEAATVLTSRSSTRDFSQDSFLIRTDHILSSRLNLGLRYVQARYTSIANSSGLPATGVRTPASYLSPAIQSTYTVSPAQVIEFRTGVMRRYSDNQINGGLPSSITGLGISPTTGVGISLTGTTAFTLPAVQPFLLMDAQTVPQVATTHTWTRPEWTLRTGLDVRWIASNFANRNFPRPMFNFIGLTGTNGILGPSPEAANAIAQSASQTIFGMNGGPATPLRGWRSTQQEYFAQADWRVKQSVTFNLGLRYSYFGVYREVNYGLSNLYAVGPDGSIAESRGTFDFGRSANRVDMTGPERSLYRPDRNNFQPRVGFAWNIGGRDVSVLRGAFGLYNDRLYQLLISDAARSVPFAVTGNANNVPFLPDRPVPINPQTPTYFGLDPTLRSPLIRRWNISFEQRLDAHTAITAAWVANHATGLYMPNDVNFTGAYPQAARPDPRFADQRIVSNLAFSRYNALQVYARRRFAHGFTFTTAYTYSRYREITSNDTGPVLPTTINTGATAAPGFQIGPTIPRPIDSEYGLSENDSPHALAVSYLWDIPVGRRRSLLRGMPAVLDAVIGGWSLSGFVNARSGNTFDVQLGQDVNDDGAFNDRPALASGANLNNLRATEGLNKTQWLLPQADANRVLVPPANVVDPFSSIRRNSFRGPALVVLDASMIKRIHLREGVALNVEGNFFNVLNRANFRPPVSTLTSPFFGQVQATAVNSTPRQIQLGLKIIF